MARHVFEFVNNICAQWSNWKRIQPGRSNPSGKSAISHGIESNTLHWKCCHQAQRIHFILAHLRHPSTFSWKSEEGSDIAIHCIALHWKCCHLAQRIHFILAPCCVVILLLYPGNRKKEGTKQVLRFACRFGQLYLLLLIISFHHLIILIII